MTDIINRVGRRSFLKRAGNASLTGIIAAGGFMSAREFLLRRGKEFSRKWSAGQGMVKDPAILDLYASDFGHVVYQRPAAVLYPETVEDIQELMYFCNEHSVPMNTRGVGHACKGQSLIEGGIILDMRPVFNKVRMEADLAAMDSGITWLEAQKHLNRHNRGAPVVPDFMGITVGGNLSIGGIGTRSVHLGYQSDHVLEMDVVTGQGELVTCSPDENSDLFRYTLHGLGQLSVMVRIKTRTIPYKPRSQLATIYYKSYDEYIRKFHRVVAEDEHKPYDFIYGFWTHGSYVHFIRAGKDDMGNDREMEEFRKWASSLGGKVHFNSVDDFELWDHSNFAANVKDKWNWHHIYCDTAPPPDIFIEMSEYVHSYLSNNMDIAQYMNLYGLPCKLGVPGKFPLNTMPEGVGAGVSVGLEFDIPRNDEYALDKTRDFVAMVTDKYLPRGLGIYMYSWYRLTAEQRRIIWARALPGFAEVKKRTDPNGVINPRGAINNLII